MMNGVIIISQKQFLKRRFIQWANVGVGLLLLLTAVVITVTFLEEEKQAEQYSERLLEQVRGQRNQPSNRSPDESSLQQSSGSEYGNSDDTEVTAAEEPAAVSEQEIYEVAGILSLPDLDLELPVLTQSDKNRLKKAVGCYSGVYYPQPDRLIIAGHNYRRHFGRIKDLPVGALVCYESVDGVKYTYKVQSVEQIDAEDVEALHLGKWDITLLTCALDRSKRILVRCGNE